LDDRPFSLGGILYLNDPNAATPLEHVGTALITVNDLTTARYHLLESVAIRENLLGPCSPETAAYLLRLSSLQNTVFNLPRAAEATLKRCLLASEEFFRIIADTREGCGIRGQRGGVSAQAPRTLAVYPAALSSIGLLLMDADRLLEAKGYLGKALEADRALYGRDHPEVAGDLTNLAVLFCSLEGKGGALTEKFLRRSLEVFEAARRQGRCNASTLADAVNNVAAAVRLRGQFEEVCVLLYTSNVRTILM
jgi:tetratricopeptide (TPR) repeat protein